MGRSYTRVVADYKPIRGGASTSANQAEKNRKAWEKANEGMANDAFADNIIVDESHGVYYPKSLHIEIDTDDTQAI